MIASDCQKPTISRSGCCLAELAQRQASIVFCSRTSNASTSQATLQACFQDHKQKLVSAQRLRKAKVNLTDSMAPSANKQIPSDLSPRKHAAASQGGIFAAGSNHQQLQAASDERQNQQTDAKSKALPVLPWMRVPISIQGGKGMPLCKVHGLHPLALASLQSCKLLC